MEQLLYPNEWNKSSQKEIPVSVITLDGVKVRTPSGTPFGELSHPLEYDDSNFTSKIIIDDVTKEIIGIYQTYNK